MNDVGPSEQIQSQRNSDLGEKRIRKGLFVKRFSKLCTYISSDAVVKVQVRHSIIRVRTQYLTMPHVSLLYKYLAKTKADGSNLASRLLSPNAVK